MVDTKKGDNPDRGGGGLLDNPQFKKYLASLPTHRLAILAITDLESGETSIVESRQTGDASPKTRVISEKSKGEE